MARRRNTLWQRPRDAQRSRLYQAERAAFAAIDQHDVSTPAKLRDRLTEVLDDSRFRAAFAKTLQRPVAIEFGRLRGANANGDRLRFGVNSFALQEWVMLHELSHLIVRREYPLTYVTNGKTFATWREAICERGSQGHLGTIQVNQPAGHGARFAATYLQLVEWFMGDDAAQRLRNAFHVHRVSYTREAPRTPQTPKGPPRAEILTTICTELGVSPKIARRKLRKAGLRAPYLDATRIREILEH